MTDKNDLIQLLQKQSDEIAGNLKTTYSLYLNWYSFFIVINLTALSFMDKSPSKIIVMIVFFILDISSVVLCRKMYAHLNEQADKIHSIRKDIWDITLDGIDDKNLWESFNKSDFEDKLIETTPKEFAGIAIDANTIGIISISIIWFILLFKSQSEIISFFTEFLK